MTIPHLMNCDHSEGGWCLDCVGAQHTEIERLRASLAEVNIAAHSLSSRLTVVPVVMERHGPELIRRGDVMELVVRWRQMWDKAVGA